MAVHRLLRLPSPSFIKEQLPSQLDHLCSAAKATSIERMHAATHGGCKHWPMPTQLQPSTGLEVQQSTTRCKRVVMTHNGVLMRCGCRLKLVCRMYESRGSKGGHAQAVACASTEPAEPQTVSCKHSSSIASTA